MRRRITGIALALALVSAALLLGLASLVREVTGERNDGRTSLQIRERLLTEHAQNRLFERLERRLAEQRRLIEEALDKPLAPCPGCYYSDGEKQRLPRRTPHGQATGTPVRDARAELRQDSSAGADPWSQRVRLQRDCRARSPGATAAILAHNARFVFPFEQELASLMAIAESCEASPALLRALLRDGISSPGGRPIEGLQPLVLRYLGALGPTDAGYVIDETRRLSTAAAVKLDDFDDRLRERPAHALFEPPPKVEDGARLAIARSVDDQWYLLEPAPVGVRGMQLEFGALLTTIGREMQSRSLLGSEDRLLLRIPDLEPGVSSQLSLAVVSPEMERARAALEHRYAVKLALLALCGIMAIVIAVLAIAFQKRRRRVLELKSHFVASVSHELRTPLASMRLLAETLARKTAGQQAVRDYPERLLRDIDGMTFLVENILSFNRLAKGRWKPRKEPVSLVEVLERACAEAAEHVNRPVEHSIDVGQCAVAGDAELLQLLFRNLANNAVTYNQRSPAVIEVTARVGRDQGIELFFTDNGVGVPEDERERVFAEFERGTTGSMARGSGLGLSLCRRVMTLHGGTIAIDRSGPEGTSFRLHFPCTASS